MGVRRAINLISLICLPLLLQCGVVYALDPLRAGDTITLTDINPHQTFRVIQPLGQGGLKVAYRVQRITPPCEVNCEFVISRYQNQDRDAYRPAREPVTDKLRNEGTSPYIRREYAERQASIDGIVESVALSEFAEGTAASFPFSRPGGILALEILGEQIYTATREFDRRGLVNADIKTENILVSSAVSGITPECIISGNCHFVIADLDLVEKIGPRDTPRGTPAFLPPEILSRVTPEGHAFPLVERTLFRYDTSTALWATSITLWEQYAQNFLSSSDETRWIELRQNRSVRYLDANGRYAELIDLIRTRMNAHARKLAGDGLAVEADSVRRLQRRILNGLAWNPEDRRLQLPGETTPLSHVSRHRPSRHPGTPNIEEMRVDRNRRILERATAQRGSWSSLRPISEPVCDRGIRAVLRRMWLQQRGQ